MTTQSSRSDTVHFFALFEEGQDERQIEQILRLAMLHDGPVTISCKTRAIRRRVKRIAGRIGFSIA